MNKKLAIAAAVVCAITMPILASAQEWYVPIEINAWVDSRTAYKDRDWDSDNAHGQHLSDHYVRYAGLGLTGRPNNHIECRIEILFEEYFADSAGDCFDTDQAWLKLQHSGFFIRMGEMNFDYGHETTFAFEDPLTWHFSDIRRSGIEAGFENDYMCFAIAVFNGDFDTVDEKGNAMDERIDDYVLHVDFHPLAGVEGADWAVGGGFLSDVAETQLEFGDNYFIAGSPYRYPISAWSVFTSLSLDAGFATVLIDAEHIESREFSERNYVDARGDKTSIGAGNYEIALLFAGRFWIGAQYANMRGLDWLGAGAMDPALTPVWFESQGGFAGVSVTENLTLATQFISGRDSEGNKTLETYFQVLVEI